MRPCFPSRTMLDATEAHIGNLLKTLVQEFGWVHLGLGLTGNIAFFIGSIFFLPAFEHLKTYGVWLFIVGAGGMLIGSLGNLLVNLWQDD